jgi:error-prone DNA polymerase
VIQWDKDDLDALGLLKIDCLALGMLSAIRRALDLVNDWQGRASIREPARIGRHAALPSPSGSGVGGEGKGKWTMANVPPEDPEVYAMIRKADTIGVFQIESRAQMAMLPRLAPRTFYDLVIEVAIVRPGPIMGGMVHPYLRRREGNEAVTYASEDVKKVLERTLGVSIFQEQVMQLAVVAAGFTAGEADKLRRAMAAWRRRGGIEPFRDKLINGMLERGYELAYAEQIFQQIQGFGEYGFPESHAASFALLVYVSSWLKCHEPAAFACALLNSQPMGFYSPSSITQDAKRHGVVLLPADVQKSDVDCTLEDRNTLRLGLGMIKGLRADAAARLVAARNAGGPFMSTEDLARRAVLDRSDLSALAAADAMSSLSGHRREALWETLAVDAPTRLALPSIVVPPPKLDAPTEGQEIVGDYDTMGLTLRRHPLALLREKLARRRIRSAEQVSSSRNGQLIRTAGIVTCRQRPATASGVIFVTLEDETGHVNLIVWNDLAERQRRELLGSRLLAVQGEVQREGRVVHVLARRLEDLSPMLGRLATTSHDFH